MEINNFCRLCAKSCENKLENDLFAKYNKCLLQQIKELTGITLKAITRQKLPRYFCSKCKDDLSNAYEFRHRIRKAQNYFKSEDYKQKFVDNVATETTQMFDTVFLPIKQENDEGVTKPILNFDSQSEEKSQLIAQNENEIDMKPNIKIDMEETETDPNFDIYSHSSSKESDDCDKDLRGLNTKIKLKSKKIIKPKVKKLKTPGEKLYKCHHCELEFKRPNTRTKHERLLHSRDWPFQCAECGKRFTTHDAGRNHMVVHTKIRNFHCTICKSSFLLKKHLTTHYRSETHKNNERKMNEDNGPSDVFVQQSTQQIISITNATSGISKLREQDMP